MRYAKKGPINVALAAGGDLKKEIKAQVDKIASE